MDQAAVDNLSARMRLAKQVGFLKGIMRIAAGDLRNGADPEYVAAALDRAREAEDERVVREPAS